MTVKYHIAQSYWEELKDMLEHDQNGQLHALAVPRKDDTVWLGEFDFIVQDTNWKDDNGVLTPILTIGT